MTTVRWTPSEAGGVTLKESGCGMVAHSSGEEKLCDWWQWSTHPHINQQQCMHIKSTMYPGEGWTNEFHCFTSGEHTQYTYQSAEM